MTELESGPSAKLGPWHPSSLSATQEFSRRLEFEVDVADLHAAQADGSLQAVTLLDVRSAAAWSAGHIPGAHHLPRAEIDNRAGDLLPRGSRVVVYCWGPGCNGATKSALVLSALGYQVKVLQGGYEYWVREGLAVQAHGIGLFRRPADPLTTETDEIGCRC